MKTLDCTLSSVLGPAHLSGLFLFSPLDTGLWLAADAEGLNTASTWPHPMAILEAKIVIILHIFLEFKYVTFLLFFFYF